MASKAKKAGRVAKRIGKGLLGRAKPRAMSAGMGAAIRLVESAVGDSVGFVKDRWYGGPLLMLGASLALPEKLAVPLATIAGYKGAFNYQVNEFNHGRTEKNPVPMFEAEKAKNTGLLNQPSGNTSNIDETDDAGLMFN